MRKLLLLLIPIFFLSCGKDEESNAPDSLVGTKWGYFHKPLPRTHELKLKEYQPYIIRAYWVYCFIEFDENNAWAEFVNIFGGEGYPDYQKIQYKYNYKKPNITIYDHFNNDTLFASIDDNTFNLSSKKQTPLHGAGCFLSDYANMPLSFLENGAKEAERIYFTENDIEFMNKLSSTTLSDFQIELMINDTL